MSEVNSRNAERAAFAKTHYPARTRTPAAGVPPSPGESVAAKGLLARTRERAASALRQLPGAAAVESRLQKVEKTVLRELKQRIDGAVGSPSEGASVPRSETRVSRTYVHPIPEPANRAFADLLARAENQTEAQAQALYCSHLVAQLLPDEARMISTLSDGKPRAAIHIALAPLIGSATHRVVENLSLVGDLAKVAWPTNAPAYMAHLIQLGIVEDGPETRGMDNAYAALEAGSDARNRIAQAQAATRLHPRFTRRTVRLTSLGRVLLENCRLEVPVPVQ